jgi:hypothetical protein
LEAGIGGGLSTALRPGLNRGGLEFKFGRGLGPLDRSGTCNIPAQGLTGLIGYSYQQVVTSFPEANLQRTLKLSVFGLEQFQDG